MPGVGTEVARDETDGQGFGHGHGDGLWGSGRSIRRRRIDVTFGARRPRSRTGGLAGSGVASGGRLERKARRPETPPRWGSTPESGSPAAAGPITNGHPHDARPR